MSKDMLGPLTRALVGVPQQMLGIFADISNRVVAEDGENFYNELVRFVQGWKKYRLELILDIASRLQSNQTGGAFYSDLAKFVREWEESSSEDTVRL